MPNASQALAVAAPSRRQGRLDRRVAALLSAWLAGFGLVGCGTSETTADPPSVRSDEFAEVDGEPCPTSLPMGDDPSGYGFGVEEPALELPNLLEPQEAWVCGYSQEDSGAWKRFGEPSAVPADDLPDLRAALDELALVDRDQACTADLGPRWMVVYAHDGDLTGVVVDDYGCRTVRLTDKPHETPPGADGQEGTVSGTLDGGRAILAALRPVPPN